MPRKRDRLVDLSRAAELIGLSYNGMKNAVEAELVVVHTTFEKSGGRAAPLIRLGDLNDYRKHLIAQYKGQPAKADRLRALRKTRLV